MKRLLSLFVVVSLILTCGVASADGDSGSSEGKVVSTNETRASRSVYLEETTEMIYECPVRKRYIHVTFRTTTAGGPESICVGLKYLNPDTNAWTTEGKMYISLNGTANFVLPVDARYRVYIKRYTGGYGTVNVSISAESSS